MNAVTLIPHPSRQLLAALFWIASKGLVSAWTPGTYPAPSRGFAVDTTDRNDVVSFWQGVYKASEGYEERIAWTGNYTTAAPFTNAAGTVSVAFVADVERRVNFFRALSGIPADVRVNTGSSVVIDPADPNQPAAGTLKSVAAQQSAYMVIRTFHDNGRSAAGLSHTPIQADCVAWSTAAWNANFRGNIALGFFGPGAINAYLSEDTSGLSGWNTGVGHRRWILNPRSTDFATGDTPGLFDGSTIRPPTNVFYVIQNPAELSPVLPPKFVAYPNAGYFPAPLNTRFWSLSYPGANFSEATITMTTAGGVVVPVVKQPVQTGFGLPTVVWQVPASASAVSVAADTTFHVTVNGITGTGVPSSHSYTVTLIDPEVVTAPQTLVGTAAPPAAVSVNYWFVPPTHAEAVEVNAYQSESVAWTEGAEDSHPNLFIDRRSHPDAYPLRQGELGGIKPINGSKSYRLTFPVQYDIMANGTPTQILEMDRDILPHTSPRLRFSYRRGYMGTGEQLVTEFSSDGGATWSQIGVAISGKADLLPDISATTVDVNLPVSTSPIRLRFRYLPVPNQSFYWQAGNPTIITGILLDNITLLGCNWLVLRKANEIPVSAGHLVFNSASAGQALVANQKYELRLRTKLGNVWMPYGPAKSVVIGASALSGFDGWAEYTYPILTGGFGGDHSGDGMANGIAYAFGKNPLVRNAIADTLIRDNQAQRLMLSRPLASAAAGITYGAEWSDNLTSWSSAGVVVSTHGGLVEAQAPMGPGNQRFMRWKITKP
jgi:hypothetical protein